MIPMVIWLITRVINRLCREVICLILSSDETRPIYLQIAEWIEDEILKGNIKEGQSVASTNQLAASYQINPATAGKGINMLVDEGILYKKRGIGMFVAEGARKYIVEKRKKKFFEDYILRAIQEGQKLDISKEDILNMIKSYDGGEER